MRKQGRSGLTLSVMVGGTALALTAAAMIGVSAASEPTASTADASVGQIVCPDVAGALPEVPAQAKAEVDRNLALLQTQIAESQKVASGSGSEQDIAEAKIELEVSTSSS